MSLLQHAPAFDAAGAAALARELYGLDAAASPLASERDQNFLLTTRSGGRFTLKIANALEERALLEAQNAAMAHVAVRTALCPVAVPATSGEAIERVTLSGARHFVRLLTWIPGQPLAAVPRHSEALLGDLGRRLGEMDRALESFDHPAIHRDFYWDLARASREVAAGVGLIGDKGLRAAVEAAARDAEAEIARLLPHLRRAAIHGDANDRNVLVSMGGDVWTRGQTVTGFVDFGDMVHSYAASDLAIAIAYAVLDKRDPVAVARAVCAGYHAARPLTDDELAALFGFVRLRLCASVCVAARQLGERPGDAYLAISQGPIARSLPRLAAVPSGFMEASLRAACGLDPSPRSTAISTWLAGQTSLPPVIAVDGSRAHVLDLSVSSPLVSGDLSENAEPPLTARIEQEMGDSGASVGIGRYGEPRLLYSSPLFAGDERRTIHLGVDLFAPVGTAVHAPLDGTVEIAEDNAAPLDYGPMVVLRHVTDDVGVFFTLYGHLSRESLLNLETGRRVAAGESFAAIGAASVNGGWTPHLHFQLITDLLDKGRDFPGVCRASERDAWEALSPDPNAILRLEGARFPSDAIETPHAIAHRRRRIGPNLSVAYRKPVKLVRGWMQYVYDGAGRQYVDAYNNVPHVGHCHPRVAGAAAAQLRVLNTNTRYVHDALGRYAERLSSTLPEPLRVCYFVNSGSEANELALRLARAHTGRRDVIVLDAAYHGNTTTLVKMSPYKFNGPGGEGRPRWVHVAALPDVYRGPCKKEDPAAGEKYAADVQRVVEAVGGAGRSICAFVAETCPSVGGQIMLPDGYLGRAYQYARAAGGVCIADEVQTAYGRVGTDFYAFTAHHVVPDIVVLGKPIGNGYPLGAVITTPEIAASFDNGMEFFSTFGGSTVSCAVGLAVLDVVQDEQLQRHAREVGERLSAHLQSLARDHSLIGDVRGSGLFIGVELVGDRATLAPATAEAAYVVNRLREEGILIGMDGPFDNVLKIRPPMPFGFEDADRLAETLDAVLREPGLRQE